MEKQGKRRKIVKRLEKETVMQKDEKYEYETGIATIEQEQ